MDWSLSPYYVTVVTGTVTHNHCNVEGRPSRLSCHALTSIVSRSHVYRVTLSRLLCQAVMSIVSGRHVYRVRLSRLPCQAVTSIVSGCHVYRVGLSRLGSVEPSGSFCCSFKQCYSYESAINESTLMGLRGQQYVDNFIDNCEIDAVQWSLFKSKYGQQTCTHVLLVIYSLSASMFLYIIKIVSGVPETRVTSSTPASIFEPHFNYTHFELWIDSYITF